MLKDYPRSQATSKLGVLFSTFCDLLKIYELYIHVFRSRYEIVYMFIRHDTEI